MAKIQIGGSIIKQATFGNKEAALNEENLDAVIAHECGYILYRHVQYYCIA